MVLVPCFSFKLMLVFIALWTCANVISADLTADGVPPTSHIFKAAPRRASSNRNLRRGTVSAIHEERGIPPAFFVENGSWGKISVTSSRRTLPALMRMLYVPNSRYSSHTRFPRRCSD
ncbi:hypothetical protein PsorP6_014877 [Peronosclerospora sorghi]|uniref:Uncharacterized protein n=1 Tax=Peronosclerospora sorghi TaxID=230839 RepID=A0ACC0VS40_9STRA|nr:hypothetical protein PsorP6_014877 [Peronosclerospora sorghi]